MIQKTLFSLLADLILYLEKYRNILYTNIKAMHSTGFIGFYIFAFATGDTFFQDLIP